MFAKKLSVDLHPYGLLRINYCFAGVTGFEPVTNGLALMDSLELSTLDLHMITNGFTLLNYISGFFIK